MAERKVIMDVSPNGKTSIRAEGYEGGTCLDATAAFENLFSKVEQERVMVGECAGSNPDMGERVR